MIGLIYSIETLTASEIVKATGGILLRGNGDEKVCGISIDSRTLEPDSLFIPVKGENFDGHTFIKNVCTSCVGYLTEQDDIFEGGFCIKVESTKKALLDLASYYRSKFDVTLIGVTGSVGKTTTKEFIYSVLSEYGETLKTEGNFNNEIGLPLTLFGLKSSHKLAVIEMGMSNFGEIERLSKCAKPDIAVITNVGSMHGEYLGGRAGIAAEKARIAAFGAKAVICPDDPLILNEVARCTDIGNITVMLIGGEISDGAVNTVTVCKNGAVAGCGRFDVIFTDSLGQNIKYTGFTAPIVGDHGVHDSALAVTLGLRLGMSVEDIKSGLRRYTAVSMRQEIRRDGEITRIIDCYNSGPESARAALSALAEYSDVYGCERRIAVLGDMLELGDASEREHRALGGVLSSYGVELLFTVGERAELIAAGALENGFAPSRVRSFSADTPRDEIGRVIEAALRPRDIVLYKASRGIGLEGVIGYGRN